MFCVIVRKACYIPAPESNGHIKKGSYTVLGLLLLEVFQQSVCSAVAFLLLLPSGQSSAELLLACSRDVWTLSTVW